MSKVVTHGGRGRALLLSFICPEYKVTVSRRSHGSMDIADKWIKGSTGQLPQHIQSPCGREATNLMLKMPEMGLCMRQHEGKPHGSHHGQEQGVLPAFCVAKPAHVPGLPQDEKGTEKGKEEEKCTRVAKIWVPCSSSHTKVAKTCREGKKAKAKTAAVQRRITIS